MPKVLDTPDFKSETEEAEWWFSNQDLLLREFEEAAADGTLGKGTLSERYNIPVASFRVGSLDMPLVEQQAKAQGLTPQAYLEQLVHETLVNKAAKAA